MSVTRLPVQRQHFKQRMVKARSVQTAGHHAPGVSIGISIDPDFTLPGMSHGDGHHQQSSTIQSSSTAKVSSTSLTRTKSDGTTSMGSAPSSTYSGVLRPCPTGSQCFDDLGCPILCTLLEPLCSVTGPLISCCHPSSTTIYTHSTYTTSTPTSSLSSPTTSSSPAASSLHTISSSPTKPSSSTTKPSPITISSSKYSTSKTTSAQSSSTSPNLWPTSSRHQQDQINGSPSSTYTVTSSSTTVQSFTTQSSPISISPTNAHSSSITPPPTSAHQSSSTSTTLQSSTPTPSSQSPDTAPTPINDLATHTVEISVGSVVGGVALLAILIYILLRFRRQPPKITPYEYNTILSPPPSPLTPPVKIGWNPPPTPNLRDSLISSLMSTDTLEPPGGVMDNESLAARRRRDRELQKIYPSGP